MFFVTRGKAFRSVKTAGHSRFWQSERPIHRSIRQCQLSGFASGQSECPVGYAEQSQQIRSTPKDHRTRAASCRSRSQRQCSPRRRSKLHIVRFRIYAKAYSFCCSSSPTRNRFAGLQVGSENGDGDATPYAVLILNRQFHKQRQRAE